MSAGIYAQRSRHIQTVSIVQHNIGEGRIAVHHVVALAFDSEAVDHVALFRIHPVQKIQRSFVLFAAFIRQTLGNRRGGTGSVIQTIHLGELGVLALHTGHGHGSHHIALIRDQSLLQQVREDIGSAAAAGIIGCKRVAGRHDATAVIRLGMGQIVGVNQPILVPASHGLQVLEMAVLCNTVLDHAVFHVVVSPVVKARGKDLVHPFGAGNEGDHVRMRFLDGAQYSLPLLYGFRNFQSQFPEDIPAHIESGGEQAVVVFKGRAAQEGEYIIVAFSGLHGLVDHRIAVQDRLQMRRLAGSDGIIEGLNDFIRNRCGCAARVCGP